MYRCQRCGEVVPPNTPAIRIIAETRERHYPPRPKANRFWKHGREKKTDDPGGEGREIARELRVCAPCAAAASQEDHRRSPLRGPPVPALAA